jgi:glycerophosphoryl diester phosphodiesterase
LRKLETRKAIVAAVAAVGREGVLRCFILLNEGLDDGQTRILDVKVLITRTNTFKKAIVLILIITFVASAIGRENLKAWVYSFDRRFLSEHLKDLVGSVIYNEDWQNAEALSRDTDDRWLDVARNGDRPIRVAHALGGSGTPTANTYDALETSRQRGFRIFEVDLVLDSEGRLDCRHDLDQSNNGSVKICDFGELLSLVDKADGWLILDIKTDFDQTANLILKVARARNATRRIIFQLYHPEQLQWFNKQTAQLRLPLPIVTIYSARRSANHIVQNGAHLHIKVLTVPIDRLRALTAATAGVELLTHPVHSCKDWQTVSSDPRIGGIYANNGFDVQGCASRRDAGK